MQPLPPELIQHATALAAEILVAAKAHQTPRGRRQAAQVARMVRDPDGTAFSFAISDQVLRCRTPGRAARRFQKILKTYGTPEFVGTLGRVMLRTGALASRWVPGIVMPLVVARMRGESRDVVLPAEREALHRYLDWRKALGTAVNLNHLGETVLGEEEAAGRLQANLDHLADPAVRYISVKVSALFSQIDLGAYGETLDTVKERLRILYRAALAHGEPKFVNLDMEAYEDLDLTVDAFRQVLDETEFATLSAGIVLQAYLPDSFPIQQKLTDWARQRQAPVKIRIVKGANLAMETVTASLHDWLPAPYPAKVETDANFKRMLAYGCRPENAAAVRLGIASHNLFDVALALLLRDHHGVRARVEIEMLEGMANDQAAAVQERAGGLLAYAPVVHHADFPAAIAYLVRRLDENTAPENFLHDLFGMEPGSAGWEAQKSRFLEACARVTHVSSTPRRQPRSPRESSGFHNTPDTDFSLAESRAWLSDVRAAVPGLAGTRVPLQVAGEIRRPRPEVPGYDPTLPGGLPLYYFETGTVDDVNEAFTAAARAQVEWAARSLDERAAVLRAAAASIEKNRSDAIAVMVTDASKRASEADVEVSEAVDFANYYANGLRRPGFDEGTTPEPLGTVVVVPPWNFPYAIPAGGILAALAAGNAVILKPALETVLTAWCLANHLWDGGVPRGLLQFLPVPDDSTGRALITDPRAAAVVLTGSHATAQLFLDWRPDLNLLAETSGKNSLVITGNADLELAAKDLVRSAFGHSGQKCSAASLGILEADVYHDPAFRRQLRDAASSLPVGSAHVPTSIVTPLVQPPGKDLLRALTELDPGEEWLLEPRQSPENPQLWSPGVRLGVKPGSWFHQTECFGPVLGLVCVSGLEEAVRVQNATAFGLTGGIHTLDTDEIAYWKEHVEAGNAYINRATTGAVVRRQPFGGWKNSSVGPGAKAGGPNYVAVLSRWSETATPESYAGWWAREFSVEHDPSQVLGESNHFRYRPLPQAFFRALPDTPEEDIALVRLACNTCGVPLEVVPATESDSAFIARFKAYPDAVLRASGPLPETVLRAARKSGLRVATAPPLKNGRLELLHYLREQSVTETTHRYGRIPGTPTSP